MHLAELTTKYSKVSSLEKAQIGWEDEYEVSYKQVYKYHKLFLVIVTSCEETDNRVQMELLCI
jgi:hypothetical protein